MVTLGGYPVDIPVGTGVPAWAYQNISVTDGRWDASLALPQASAAPESTYYGTPTASISYRINTSGDVTSAAATETGSPSTGGKSNAGPIAGGVIGGIALLALIGGLVWRRMRRRDNEDVPPSPTAYYPPGAPQMEASHYPPGILQMEDYPSGGPQMAEANYPPMAGYGVSYPSPSPTMFPGSHSTTSIPQKLYDPEDPSTFPKTPASFGYQSTTVNYSASTPSNDGSTLVGRYPGSPEIYKR
ncbi:hypothetical protein M407DRAFT_21952 [Tulasnella calospora MUT 4182]|uniref:Transmembrane protein n=1 Tax=Tulasnella calospora MUT 4182 TaxID=1051891 RepID=A0A0C3QD94_9AGAM|nr:hypothetical protein M407DRAFT_21952 [Tulasnella calospora MUT 4182]